MLHSETKAGGDIVDNSNQEWKVIQDFREWTLIAEISLSRLRKSGPKADFTFALEGDVR
jgi:hypothetical protein